MDVRGESASYALWFRKTGEVMLAGGLRTWVKLSRVGRGVLYLRGQGVWVKGAVVRHFGQIVLLCIALIVVLILLYKRCGCWEEARREMS